MMTPLRPSTEKKIEAVGNRIATLLVALLLIATGAWTLDWQRHQATVSHWIFGVGVGLIVLGALLIRPDPIFSVVQRVFVVLGDTNLPLVGGRRKTDQPPPSAP